MKNTGFKKAKLIKPLDINGNIKPIGMTLEVTPWKYQELVESGHVKGPRIKKTKVKSKKL